MKTLEQIKEEIAKEFNHESFEDLLWHCASCHRGLDYAVKIYDAIAERYADQFKPKWVDTDQPVEKEPEPLISSRQYIEQVYGTSTFARSIECKDAESLMDMMDDFLDWAMQKQQSK